MGVSTIYNLSHLRVEFRRKEAEKDIQDEDFRRYSYVRASGIAILR